MNCVYYLLGGRCEELAEPAAHLLLTPGGGEQEEEQVEEQQAPHDLEKRRVRIYF